MAVLIDQDRADITAGVQRDLSRIRESLGLTKAELRDAVNATDTWINNNAASYNAALPTAAQSGLTANQKERLFLLVAKRRFEVT